VLCLGGSFLLNRPGLPLRHVVSRLAVRTADSEMSTRTVPARRRIGRDVHDTMCLIHELELADREA
jgi:hypothetical protein